VILTVALAFVGYVYSASKAPVYEATAQLLYAPQLDVTNPLSQGYTDPTIQELQLQSAVTMITSPTIRSAVMSQLGGAARVVDHSVSASITTSDPAASSPVDNGVAVTVDSSDANWSARLANTYASAFVAWSVASDRARLTSAETVLSTELKQLQSAGQQNGTDYAQLSQDLHALQILSATTNGNFSVAVPASAPRSASAPRPRRTAAIAGILGLVLGVGLAFGRERFNTRLRDHHEVSAIVQLPVIGRIGRIPEGALARGAIVVSSETDGRAAESIRQLRSNLQFVTLGEREQVLVVMSAQKGEGKSLLTCNLAAALALAGKKVALVDADLRRPRVHTRFGVLNQSGVSSVIAGFCSLDEATQTVDLEEPRTVTLRLTEEQPVPLTIDSNPQLTLLTAGPPPPNPGEMVASKRFASLISQLSRRKFDYILIDSPAFLAVGDAAALAAVADGIVLVVNMRMTSKTVLGEAREFLAQLPPPKLGIVTVMDTVGKNERYHYYTQNA
jgi:Mrp family chromosome partitioning ATPase/capsular polysaccharide biosynthesis protein